MAICLVNSGIINLGIQQFESAPISLGIASGAFAPISLGILDSISEPINPLAAHVGGGGVLIYCTPPTGNVIVKEYETQVSTSLTGTYINYNRSFHPHNINLIKNFPFGVDLYFRIRALSPTGLASNWVQVRRGIPQLQTEILRISAISGSSIPEGAKFITRDKADRLSGFKALTAISITG